MFRAAILLLLVFLFLTGKVFKVRSSILAFVKATSCFAKLKQHSSLSDSLTFKVFLVILMQGGEGWGEQMNCSRRENVKNLLFCFVVLTVELLLHFS